MLSTAGITSVDDFSLITAGDTLKPFAPQFWCWSIDLNKFAPQDLTGLTPSMQMKNANDEVKACNGTWTIDDAANGKASYAWQPGDVSEAGIWALYVALTNGLGQVAHAEEKTLIIKEAP